MFTINTQQGATANGAGRVIAKGHGIQRTVRIDPALTVEANHAAAVGRVLDALTDARQQAMLRHPSGGQRVRVFQTSDAGGRMRFEVNV